MPKRPFSRGTATKASSRHWEESSRNCEESQVQRRLPGSRQRVSCIRLSELIDGSHVPRREADGTHGVNHTILPKIRVVLLLGTAIAFSAWNPAAAQRPPSNVEVFDPNPNHIWNRTYTCLFVGRTSDGTEYGADALDPLLWNGTKHLLNGDSHLRALACLDVFLRS